MAINTSFFSRAYKFLGLLSNLGGTWNLLLAALPYLYKGGAMLLEILGISKPIEIPVPSWPATILLSLLLFAFTMIAASWNSSRTQGNKPAGPSWKTTRMVGGIAVILLIVTLSIGYFHNSGPFAILSKDQQLMGFLGAPQTEATPTALAEQFFQRGLMLWRKDHWDIYVLYDTPDQRWNIYQDTHSWHPEMGEDPPHVPAGLFSPELGFAVAWIRNSLLEPLGWATAKANHLLSAHIPTFIQTFERGVIIGPVSQGPTWECPPQCFLYVLLQTENAEHARTYQKREYPVTK